MTQIRAVVFDAYGTLLDIHAAMAPYAGHLGQNWLQISSDWRAKQLEYGWVRSLAGPGRHRDFWTLTREALAWTAARHGIHDAALLEGILSAYRHLAPYPEVPSLLAHIRGLGLTRAILSNGETTMLADAVRSAGIAELLDTVLSVDAVGVFKPDPRVYRLATDRLGLAAESIAFVSSNPWDAFGAHAFGFRVFHVDRAGAPPEYGLADSGVTVIAGLSDLPSLLS